MSDSEKKTVQTPEETEQAVSDLADKLEEIDKAEGVFGEVTPEEELDEVAGGSPLRTNSGGVMTTVCKACGRPITYQYPNPRPLYCSEGCANSTER